MGISLVNSDDNTLRSNTANLNVLDGFDLDVFSSNNNLNFNDAFDNFSFGFDERGIGNNFLNNNCDGNVAGGSNPSGLCAPQL